MTLALKREICAGSKIRALVVDDSVVIRRLVTHALSEDPEIEVVGSASDGLLALARIPQVNPHVVTLDIEMPNLDGLATLQRIRKQYPDIVVIMFSTLTERGAAVTMEALALGAQDYVTKASNSGSLDRSLESLRVELIPKVKQFFRMAKTNAHPEPVISVAPSPARASNAAARPGVFKQVVVIGVSTGGPNALATLIPALPSDFRVPVLIVQHMPPVFTARLALRLTGVSALETEEGSPGALLRPGRA